MYFKYRQSAITLLLLLAVSSFLVTWPAGKAFAAPPVLDIEIDSPGTIQWDISNIKPGDSGLEPVTLRNAGDATGYLCIWINDIIDDEGINPESETGNTANPGELSSYLDLDIINNGMTFARLTDGGHEDVELPISLINFPADINHALCIKNPPIDAGQALEVQWQWTLPPETGNDVQGDNVSFSIFYSLISEIPSGTVNPPGGGFIPQPPPTMPIDDETIPPEPTSTPDIPGPEIPVTPTPSTDDDKTQETELPVGARLFVSEDGKCYVYVPEGVEVTTDSVEELLNISIDTPENIPPIPESYITAISVYRFYCETPDGITSGTQLTNDVQITIYFDPDMIPENAEVSIFIYHPESSWIKIDSFGDFSRGRLSAWIDYLDTIAVLVFPEGSTEIDTEPASTALGMMPDAGETTDRNAIPRQVSLGVAVSGTIAMTILAGIERRRRNAAMKRSKTDEPVES